MKRSVVVFDFGGVLIDWNPRYFYRQFFRGDDEKVEWFLAEVCNHEWNLRHDAGVPFEKNAEALVERFPEHKTAIWSYFIEFEKMFGPPMQESINIAKELFERNRPLYALTNWSAETFPRARKMFPFFSWFKGILVSGEVGLAKPDPKIYHKLLKTFSLRAEEAVFIDDRKENVVAAEKIGFHSIHFQSAEKLRNELASLKLLD